jgi:glycosyltransferase involved in cell wall biosynthesis
MSTPKISVALCTYNGEVYLREQIESILNQMYQNLEIVIVDDCSDDNSLKIAKEYEARDTRVKVFRNEINLGYNKNFERAIRQCTGDYIAISDQDDIWVRDKVDRLFNNIGDNWLIFSNSALIYDTGEIKEGKLLYKFKYGQQSYKSMLLGNFVTGHTCLMKREFLTYILPFPESGYYDWWMGFIAIYHNKLIYLKELLTHYRVHENSVTQQEFNDKERHLIHYSHVLNMLKNFLNYDKLKKADKDFITQLYKSYSKKTSSNINLPLILLTGKYYSDLFPSMKQRTWLSKMNFARKFSRKF